MRSLTAAAVLAAASLVALPAEAQRATVLQARTAGELADLCAANPKEALGDAKINFCHGYIQGAIQTDIRRSEGKKAFCFPNPQPTRTETTNDFVKWVRASPDRKTPPAVEGLFQFLSERYPCK